MARFDIFLAVMVSVLLGSGLGILGYVIIVDALTKGCH